VRTADTYETGVRRHLLPFSITTYFPDLFAELVRLVGGNAKVVVAGGKQNCFDCLTFVSVYTSENIVIRTLLTSFNTMSFLTASREGLLVDSID
jgi:hypothetical protein